MDEIEIVNDLDGIKRIYGDGYNRRDLTVTGVSREIIEHNRVCDKNIKTILYNLKKYEVFRYKPDNGAIMKHLWSFWGELENGKWACIEVGSSIDIINEICGIIRLMNSKTASKPKTGVMYQKYSIYEFDAYSDKNSCKYRSINKLFKNFLWLEINAEEFTKAYNVENYNIVNYAEVRYAIDKAALVWNPAPATNGNQEKEILIRLSEGGENNS